MLYFITFVVNDTGVREVEKNIIKCDVGGGRFKKCNFLSDIF